MRSAHIGALLVHTNQYCDTDRRDQVIRAVHAATGDSDVGLALAEEWYRRRDDFPGSERLAATWRALPRDVESVDGFRRSATA